VGINGNEKADQLAKAAARAAADENAPAAAADTVCSPDEGCAAFFLRDHGACAPSKQPARVQADGILSAARAAARRELVHNPGTASTPAGKWVLRSVKDGLLSAISNKFRALPGACPG
jgi:hypothetical protein